MHSKVRKTYILGSIAAQKKQDLTKPHEPSEQTRQSVGGFPRKRPYLNEDRSPLAAMTKAGGTAAAADWPSSMLGVRLIRAAEAAAVLACCAAAARPSLAAPLSRLLWLKDLGSWLRDLRRLAKIGMA